MLKKLVKLIFGLLLIIAFGLTGLNYLGIYLDEESITEIELIPLTKVPSEENAFEVIEAIFDEKKDPDWSTLKNLRGDGWDQLEVKKVLDENVGLLKQLPVALERERFMSYPIDFESDFADYQRYTGLVDLLILRSRLSINEGRYDETLNDIRLALKLSELVKADESAILISYAFGNALEHRTLNWIHRLASNHDLSSAQLSQLASLFDLLPDYHEDRFEMVFSGEYAYTKTMSNDLLSPPFLERVDWLFDGTIEMRSDFGQSESALIDVLSVPSYNFFFQKKRTHNSYISLLNHFQSQVKESFCNKINYQTPVRELSIFDSLGMNILGKNTGTFDTYISRRCFSNFYAQAAKVSIALKRYSVDIGNQAETLQQLVPKHLKRVPVDAFTGEPLLFNYKAQTLYSRGLNFRDDGAQQETYVRKCEANEVCANNPAISIDIDIGNTME